MNGSFVDNRVLDGLVASISTSKDSSNTIEHDDPHHDHRSAISEQRPIQSIKERNKRKADRDVGPDGTGAVGRLPSSSRRNRYSAATGIDTGGEIAGPGARVSLARG